MELDEEIVDDFESGNGSENKEIQKPLSIKKSNFDLDKIIKTLQDAKLLQAQIICPICHKIMSMVSTKDTIDNKYWKCRGIQPLHDQKN